VSSVTSAQGGGGDGGGDGGNAAQPFSAPQPTHSGASQTNLLHQSAQFARSGAGTATGAATGIGAATGTGAASYE